MAHPVLAVALAVLGAVCFAADAMALPHLVHPGYNGWLYPPDDVPALTTRLASLLADPAQRRRMGAASRAIVAGHDLDDTLATFEGLYRRALHLTAGHRDDRPAPYREPGEAADALLVPHRCSREGM
jgi:glycosyltransferase involved in cell wall biosynthesis